MDISKQALVYKLIKLFIYFSTFIKLTNFSTTSSPRP